MHRREVLAAGAALALSGCAVPPVFANMGTALRTTVVGLPDAPITSQYVDNLPYASISAKIGRGQRSLVVLARYDGPDLHWISEIGRAHV